MSARHRQTPTVTIIVVSFNTRELTCACLRSITADTRDTALEIIVVDNASHDGSAETIASDFPHVRLIALDENVGFGRANNIAAKQANGEFILLLNSDTFVRGRAIDRLISFARCCPHAGIWGGRTLFGDGRLNPSSCWARMTVWNQFCRASGLAVVFKGREVFNGETYGGWKRDTARDVDIVSGCFLLIKRQTWNALGGFDPAFFMYGEDADLCLRARATGFRPMITPDAEIVHHGGASDTVRADKLVKLLTAKTMLTRRHMSPARGALARLFLSAWPLSRLLAHAMAGILLGGTHRERAAIWQQVWLRRSQWRNGFPEMPGRDQVHGGGNDAKSRNAAAPAARMASGARTPQPAE